MLADEAPDRVAADDDLLACQRAFGHAVGGVGGKGGLVGEALLNLAPVDLARVLAAGEVPEPLAEVPEAGLEVLPPRPEDSQAVGGSFNPVHVYLLVEQGVHILEFHNQEQLAADRVYEFAYVATTNAIRGTVAGTALRPIALH